MIRALLKKRSQKLSIRIDDGSEKEANEVILACLGCGWRVVYREIDDDFFRPNKSPLNYCHSLIKKDGYSHREALTSAIMWYSASSQEYEFRARRIKVAFDRIESSRIQELLKE